MQRGISSKAFPDRCLRKIGKLCFGAVRCGVIPARLQAPSPLAGRWARTGTTRAGGRPRGELNPAPGLPVSADVHEVSRPELAHSWCARLSDVAPASRRMRRRSAEHEAGWPRSRCNWCGRSEDRAVFPVGTFLAERPPDRSVRARFRHTAPTLGK